MQRLVALKPHIYNGKSLRAGDIYHATNAHAKVLSLVRKARLAPVPRQSAAGLVPGRPVISAGPHMVAAAASDPPRPAAASPAPEPPAVPEAPVAPSPKATVDPGAVRASLLERAAALGIEVDPNWSNSKLRSEVDQVVRDRYRRRDLRSEK
jgi:hypothetical protein